MSTIHYLFFTVKYLKIYLRILIFLLFNSFNYLIYNDGMANMEFSGVIIQKMSNQLMLSYFFGINRKSFKKYCQSTAFIIN